MAVLTFEACAFTVFVLPSLLGSPLWMPMGDAKWTIQSAQYVANGGLGFVYSANTQFLPLPGFLLVLAPFAALADHFNLINNFPAVLAHPSIYPVMAPVFFATGATAVLGVDYLGATLGISRSRRRILAPATGLLVVGPTVCWMGHPEDMVALCLSCFSLGLLIRGRFETAGLVLAVAILMQPWALLLIPVLFVSTPTGRRLRTVIYASVAPALTGLVLLALDFKDAFRALVVQPMQGNGQHLPWWSLTHRVIVTQLGVPTAMRVGSGPRILAVLTAVVAAWMIRRDVRPKTIVVASAVAMCARGVFETQVWCWYLAPAGVLIALAAAMNPQSRRWAAGAVCGLVFYGCVAGNYSPDRVQPMVPVVALLVLLASAAGGLIAARQAVRSISSLGDVPLARQPDLQPST